MKLRTELKSNLPKRIVIKLGSTCVTKTTGGVDPSKLKKIIKDIAYLHQQGIEIALVCSGAIQTGRAFLKTKSKDISTLQGLSAIGQVELMHALSKVFKKYNLQVGQVLLNHQDFKRSKSYLNVKNTLELLIENKIIPIINENDTVSFEEISFGDNDQLAVMTCELLNASNLLVLSSVDGIYDSNPDLNPSAEIISHIESTSELKKIKFSGKSSAGTGGMNSKYNAIALAAKFGVTTMIGSFAFPKPLRRLMQKSVGTIYHAEEKILSARKNRLMILAQKNKYILIDAGAEVALKKGASLLLAGITKVGGDFKRGDCLFIKRGRKFIAAGLVEFSSNELIKKLELSKSLNLNLENEQKTKNASVVIHRNNMSLKT